MKRHILWRTKLQYVAKDYAAFGGEEELLRLKKTPAHWQIRFYQQLKAVRAINISKGTVVSNLILGYCHE